MSDQRLIVFDPRAFLIPWWCGNGFHITKPLEAESTGYWWIPLTKGQSCRVFMFSIFCYSKYAVEQRVKFHLIWDAKALMWHYCNVFVCGQFSDPTNIIPYRWGPQIDIKKTSIWLGQCLIDVNPRNLARWDLAGIILFLPWISGWTLAAAQTPDAESVQCDASNTYLKR